MLRAGTVVSTDMAVLAASALGRRAGDHGTVRLWAGNCGLFADAVVPVAKTQAGAASLVKSRGGAGGDLHDDTLLLRAKRRREKLFEVSAALRETVPRIPSVDSVDEIVSLSHSIFDDHIEFHSSSLNGRVVLVTRQRYVDVVRAAAMLMRSVVATPCMKIYGFEECVADMTVTARGQLSGGLRINPAWVLSAYEFVNIFYVSDTGIYKHEILPVTATRLPASSPDDVCYSL